jgi:pyridinium-3,5-bisthiocarboxylic acid mononucleotide nickel chelatase
MSGGRGPGLTGRPAPGYLDPVMDTRGRREERILIFDPFAGISGDMVIGALIDLGLSAEWLGDFVASLRIPGEVGVERVDRSGISCASVRFHVPAQHEHRHLSDILEIVERSDAPAEVRAVAEAVFRRLAEAEAAIHGVDIERVHFHEVGALDSILDVMCSVGGVHELGFQRCYTRTVAVGSGTAEMSHGTYPLPAPATARLLVGLRVRETGFPEECTTPTGAALLATLTAGAPPPREVVYGASGYGAGTRNPRGRPNCLRLIAGTASPPGDTVYLIQADIDDMSPEYVAAARDALEEAGALDVALSRIDMKKGRPGFRVEVLAPSSSLAGLADVLFTGTRTIGLRYWEVDRLMLGRQDETIEWRGQRIRRKRVRLPDGSTRAKPEFDDVLAAARELGLTPYEVRTRLEDREGHD